MVESFLKWWIVRVWWPIPRLGAEWSTRFRYRFPFKYVDNIIYIFLSTKSKGNMPIQKAQWDSGLNEGVDAVITLVNKQPVCVLSHISVRLC